MTHATRRPSMLLAAILAMVLGLVLSLAEPPTTARANPPGNQLHVFADTNEKGLAARVIRLAHAGAANGTLIATFERWNPVTNANVPYLIKRSTDDGATWTTIATVDDGEVGGTHPWPTKWTPTLIEFPTTMGAYAAGTILMVAAVYDPSAKVAQFQQWRSTNQGMSWTYGGVIATSAPNTGIWEPFLFIGGSGQLVIHYADDDESPAYDQTVAQMVSTNGGATWSTRTNIVTAGVFADRPGMPVTTKLPDGTYRLVYELCEFSIGDPRGCPVYMKSSPDGVTWTGAPSLIMSNDHRFLGSSPYIVWAPGGGPNGQLIVSGGATRNTWAPYALTNEHMQNLMVSYDLGSTWFRMPTPFKPTLNCDGINWSATLLPSADGTTIRSISPAGRAGSIQCGVWTEKANVGTLPYSASFAANDAGWVTYGGTYTVTSGQYRETSGGTNGPKAVTGSTGWSNYSVAADVSISTAGGDAGVIYRVSNSHVGPDAMQGYYAGIGVGGGLFVGKMVNGTYSTLGTAAIAGGVSAGTPYRISVAASGTQHTVTVTSAGGGSTLATLVVNDDQFLRGQVGVRNLGANAQFDNVSVTAHSSASSLPYSQSFGGAVPAFLPYGGTWGVTAGVYEQTSSGWSGPKSIVGSSSWTNYTAAVDVSVGSSSGDAGLLIRVGDNPGVGADTHTGYYAGISTGGNLFLARQNNGTYTQLGSLVPITGGVTANTFYRVSLQGSGSSLTAQVRAVGSGTLLATLTVSDANFASGRVGLRSFGTAAKFDNLSVS